MNQQELKTLLREGEVNLSFTKKNGDIREMRATTSEDLLPSFDLNAKRTKSSSSLTQQKSKPDDLIVLYDMDAQGWRSFRFDQLITVKFK